MRPISPPDFEWPQSCWKYFDGASQQRYHSISIVYPPVARSDSTNADSIDQFMAIFVARSVKSQKRVPTRGSEKQKKQ